MKIVVTSDTHGHKEILNRIVEENRDAELFLHAVFDTTPVYRRNIAKVILIPLP